MFRATIALLLLLTACASSPAPVGDAGIVPSGDASPADAATSDAMSADAGPVAMEPPYETVVDVPVAGPYGAHTFVVPARANWVDTGLYLRAGQTATIEASGTWMARGTSVGAEGDATLGPAERGCPLGALAARVGLAFEGAITCMPEAATFVAAQDGILFVGMIESTDLGEAYAERRDLDGELTVTVTSEGDTVPSVRAGDLASFPFDTVASGWVELLGDHHRVVIEASQVEADLATAASSLATLDEIWTIERDLRSDAPFFGQRVRWFPDETIADVGYMLAGNPVRCVPELMNGGVNQRILRASEGPTDIWGFSHELGHVFSFVNGTWVFQINNVESWPNLFTLRVLRTLGRTEGQPNFGTYCDGREAYLAGGAYETFRDDPFVQLCFLMQFEEEYGQEFYERFFEGMNSQTNEDVGYDGTDASVWRYVEGRFDAAAGTPTAALWDAWRVPR